ncbi:shikimate 5-dehydrogenase [Commensalibacter papalotli (ex Servin-Garciduenas et al. 2014)]|uniref:shikimate dehydrogenase (NADP(+)) n=1 Tax=Commensalibacter papalotli (ex Servin-Garciduenas et al. 2014) TaxID=1208583 RepID=W7DNN0_9PROT|nr:shikimate 5-dehydrogenase [Commensalibacter papalotli (ex Servin-Garciduenas et al. 2014)]EUK18892.1 shikimate 5-dehydrogenase [Commensalibacter papalotli (ex Servin-Garciduenas et al. 2014)]
MLNKDTKLCISLAARPSNTGTKFHNYLYNKLGLDFIYKAFTTKDIEHAIKGVRALEIRGCSVSMPFKKSCIPFVDTLSETAKAINSVNTIVNDNGHLTAYNTDYLAVKKLVEQNYSNKNMTVIIRGSGGMAKAVIAAFRDNGFTNVIIYARNEEHGMSLAKKYGFKYSNEMPQNPSEVLVNTTPIGMSGGIEENDLAFTEKEIMTANYIFDVVALPSETPLIQAARKHNKPVITGAEVIALQALEQFELYTGVRPNKNLMLEASKFSRS